MSKVFFQIADTLAALFRRLFGRGRPQAGADAGDESVRGARYVVVDLEWNQYPKWVRTPTSSGGVVMPHEIIQIGAVKVDEAFRPIETFTVGVRLQGRRKLSKHVARVVQKTQEEIDQGLDFPEAYAHFSDWSADAERFVTWGGDDLRVFQNNLDYYKMSPLDAGCWYDAQLIYARQLRGDRVQTALKTAAENLGVDEDITHHDALNDAYLTASICQCLEMDRGMEELERPMRKPAQRSENRLFMQKKFVSASCESGFATRALAKQHVMGAEVPCPECAGAMRLEPSRMAGGDRWMRMAVCAAHGRHLIRYRVRHRSDGEFTWTRTVYAPDAELEAYYQELSAKRPPTRKRPRKAPRERAEQQPAASAQG